MKSIKKHFKQLLAEIEVAAMDLKQFSTGLTLLQGLQDFAECALSLQRILTSEAAAFKKENLLVGIADSPAMADLYELTDTDIISSLEEQFFAALNNHADSDIGVFLQQLLAKIEQSHSELISKIQALNALLEEE
jgi:hypothetical protein